MRRWVAVLAAAALVQAPAAGAWSWPVDGPVLRPFVFGDDPYAAGQHRGIDIGAPAGTPVHAASAGTVSFAGTVPSGGRTVTVQTADGFSVTYLELGAIGVARAEEVGEGDPIGAVGSAEHLHLGVRVTADPQGYRDPLLFLPARVEALARAGPVEVAPPVAAQLDPVEPSTVEAADPEADGRPFAAPEPAVTLPEPVAKDAVAAVRAEPPGQSRAPAGTGESPVREAERVPTGNVPASRDVTEPTGRPRPAAALTTATPGPARATAGRSAQTPHTPVDASRAAAPSNEAAEPGARIPGEPRGEPASASGQARRPEPAGPRGARRRPERARDASASSGGLELPLGLAALALLGAAAAGAVRRRSAIGPREESAFERAATRESPPPCPIGRLRTQHSIHPCARGREPVWLLALDRPLRRKARVGMRPLPRPGRRVAGIRG